MTILSQAKISADHLSRQAYVYVRQSSRMQLRDHQESARRQYALKDRAQQLGWLEAQIGIVDVDQAHSASDPSVTRLGFQQLLAEVALGQVGAVFSLEVSRLARQDSEWHRLVEVAALGGTVLVDEQQVYDPRLADDRLVLGLKGLLSSSELRQMSLRLWENRLHKAQRGELPHKLPVGLVWDPEAGISFNPDQQVQAAVQLVFERFRLSGQITAVVRYFQDHGLPFPKHQGGWQGPLVWGPLSCPRVRSMLTNPRYAGAYAYGCATQRPEAKPRDRLQQTVVRLPPEQWSVLIWDAFPGYLSRAEYEANQAILADLKRPQLGWGRRRDGRALLSGLALCGRCGRPLNVTYSGPNSQHVTYVCTHQQRRYGAPTCQRVPGRAVDQVVAEAVLAVLTPAQIELSLAVVDELARQQQQLLSQWQLRLEDAHYAVQLAQRRYEQVDPNNRRVARTLEQAWEARLQDLEQLEADFAQHQSQAPLSLDETQRQQIHHLVQDLPTVWQAETTSLADRKRLLRLLVADVTLTRLETAVQVQIRWHTNALETTTVALPRRGAPRLLQTVVDRVRTLSQTHTDQQIAAILNQETPPTPSNQPFTARGIESLRRHYGIRKR
jgi:DNA invertase Pin-like site-specific DNA recombinase